MHKNRTLLLYLHDLIHDHMNTQTPRQEYQAPALRIIPINIENAICDSSIPGGNEDIGYEDWD